MNSADTFRMQLRRPAHTILGIFVLTLGFTVVLVIFAAGRALVLRPPTDFQPSNLRYLYGTSKSGLMRLPFTAVDSLGTALQSWGEVLTSSPDLGILYVPGGAVKPVEGELVSPNYFEVLGIRAAAGRLFRQTDDRTEATIVLGFELWKNLFGSNPEVIGTRVRLDPAAIGPVGVRGQEYFVVGVASRSFHGTAYPWQTMMYWVLAGARAADYECVRSHYLASRGFNAILRLKSGDQSAPLGPVLELLARLDRPRISPDWRVIDRRSQAVIIPFAPAGLNSSRFLQTLFAVAVAVVIVTLVHFVSLLRLQNQSRQSEMAIAIALGATRFAIVRMMLLENVIIAFPAAVASLILCRVTMAYLANAVPPTVGFGSAATVTIDGRVDYQVWVLALGLAVSVLAVSIPLGFLHLVRVSDPLGLFVRAKSRLGVGRFGYYSSFVHTWVASSLLLIAGVLLQKEIIAGGMNVTVSRPDITVATLEPKQASSCGRTPAANVTPSQDDGIADHLLRRVAQLNVAGHAAVALDLPTTSSKTWILGDNSSRNVRLHVTGRFVSPDYFSVLSIPIKLGASFDEHDAADNQPVAVVSDDLARRMWPNVSPIGQRLAFNEPGAVEISSWFVVRGVVAEPAFSTPPDPSVVYVPLPRNSVPQVLLVRPGRTTNEVIPFLTNIFAELDQRTVVTRITTLDVLESEAKYPLRMSVNFFMLIGCLVLFLTVAGIYSVVSQSISARSSEFAIRAAVGATPLDLRVLATGFGVGVAMLGLGAGSCTAGVALLLSNHLFEIDGYSVVAMIVALGVCVVAINVAAYMPCRRHWTGADVFARLNKAQ